MLKFVGVAIFIIGVLLVLKPSLVSNRPPPTNPFDAIERRIWWGALLGVGACLFFQIPFSPWLPALLALLSASVGGMIAARLLGIMIDGSVPKQWVLVGVELVVFVALFVGYRYAMDNSAA